MPLSPKTTRPLVSRVLSFHEAFSPFVCVCVLLQAVDSTRPHRSSVMDEAVIAAGGETTASINRQLFSFSS